MLKHKVPLPAQALIMLLQHILAEHSMPRTRMHPPHRPHRHCSKRSRCCKACAIFQLVIITHILASVTGVQQ